MSYIVVHLQYWVHVLYLYIRINIWSSRENDKLGKLIITFRTLRKEKFLEHLFYKSCMKDKLKETVFFLFTLTYHGLLIPVHINYLLFTDHLKIKLQFFDLINYKCLIILCVWINRYLCIAEIRLGVYSFGTHKLGAFTSHMIGGFSPNNLARCLLQYPLHLQMHVDHKILYILYILLNPSDDCGGCAGVTSFTPTFGFNMSMDTRVECGIFIWSDGTGQVTKGQVWFRSQNPKFWRVRTSVKVFIFKKLQGAQILIFFCVWFSFKNNRRTNVLFFGNFENAFKKSYWLSTTQLWPF